MEPIYCAWCGNHCPPPGPQGGASGYALTRDDVKICYDCAGYVDAMQMEATGRAVMYLAEHPDRYLGTYVVTNWPGTLRIGCHRYRTSKGRGFGGSYPRVDVWFSFQGAEWHGIHMGNNNTIIRVKRLKQRSAR